jgi:DNA-binding LacI/PurR family transcriptional regulator
LRWHGRPELDPALAAAGVEQDFEDMGTRAFDLLPQQLQGKTDLKSSVVEPQLVVRESTAPPRR